MGTNPRENPKHNFRRLDSTPFTGPLPPFRPSRMPSATKGRGLSIPTKRAFIAGTGLLLGAAVGGAFFTAQHANSEPVSNPTPVSTLVPEPTITLTASIPTNSTEILGELSLSIDNLREHISKNNTDQTFTKWLEKRDLEAIIIDTPFSGTVVTQDDSLPARRFPIANDPVTVLPKYHWLPRGQTEKFPFTVIIKYGSQNVELWGARTVIHENKPIWAFSAIRTYGNKASTYMIDKSK